MPESPTYQQCIYKLNCTSRGHFVSADGTRCISKCYDVETSPNTIVGLDRKNCIQVEVAGESEPCGNGGTQVLIKGKLTCACNADENLYLNPGMTECIEDT